MNKAITVLNFMYNMERFATQIYKIQSRAFSEPTIAEKMEFAVKNEQEHAENLRRRVIELDGIPSRLGFLFQMTGGLLSLITRCLGRINMLKTGILVEKRAVQDYTYFRSRVGFDEESAALLGQIIKDEELHIRNWQESIAVLQSDKD